MIVGVTFSPAHDDGVGVRMLRAERLQIGRLLLHDGVSAMGLERLAHRLVQLGRDQHSLHTWIIVSLMRSLLLAGGLFGLSGLVGLAQSSAPQIIHVDLAYRAPGTGPAPNFSPKGTQVALVDADAAMTLPPGATRPAKIGKLRIGADEAAWIPVLATADADHPKDLCRLFVDKNRNGNFADDPPIAPVTPSQNEKTKAWWSSFNKVELSIPYAALKTVEGPIS